MDLPRSGSLNSEEAAAVSCWGHGSQYAGLSLAPLAHELLANGPCLGSGVLHRPVWPLSALGHMLEVDLVKVLGHGALWSRSTLVAGNHVQGYYLGSIPGVSGAATCASAH